MGLRLLRLEYGNFEEGEEEEGVEVVVGVKNDAIWKNSGLKCIRTRARRTPRWRGRKGWREMKQ